MHLFLRLNVERKDILRDYNYCITEMVEKQGFSGF